jgi:hypothetical protein
VIITETIEWNTEGFPDDECTVFIKTKGWIVDQAFRDAGEWLWVSGGTVDDVVLAWADLPDGPTLEQLQRKGAA